VADEALPDVSPNTAAHNAGALTVVSCAFSKQVLWSVSACEIDGYGSPSRFAVAQQPAFDRSGQPSAHCSPQLRSSDAGRCAKLRHRARCSIRLCRVATRESTCALVVPDNGPRAVFITGTIHNGDGFGASSAYCRWRLITGADWALLDGEARGHTQMGDADPVRAVLSSAEP
jgi:hypothetical protein